MSLSGNCWAMDRPRPRNSLKDKLLTTDKERREDVKPPIEIVIRLPGPGCGGDQGEEGEESDGQSQHTELTVGHRLLKLSRVISPLKWKVF